MDNCVGQMFFTAMYVVAYRRRRYKNEIYDYDAPNNTNLAKLVKTGWIKASEYRKPKICFEMNERKIMEMDVMLSLVVYTPIFISLPLTVTPWLREHILPSFVESK